MSEAERKRHTLREQLTRAGGALASTLGLGSKAGKGRQGAAESKQRLSDVLWNDRSLAAAHAVGSKQRDATEEAEPAAVGPASTPAPRARVATPSQPVPKAAPIPAGAFAPPRDRRATPTPPPVPELRSTEAVLSDLESLMAADQRQVRP
ncbi:MAG TPA: hypothetical protein VJR89_40320, partial [Polyangiales bacterium]|nr:hypothetical protein [Polyangiales bacterium]